MDFNNEEDRKQLVEILIYNAKQKSLDKLLGDHIVKQYKKEKPEDQMFHTTDCSRLNYIVRQLMENALIWSVDKSGIEICSSIIKPLIKKCITPLLEYQKELLEEMGKGDYTKQADVELIINLIISMESGTLETEINKYIAPYFNLDKNKLKEFCEAFFYPLKVKIMDPILMESLNVTSREMYRTQYKTGDILKKLPQYLP